MSDEEIDYAHFVGRVSFPRTPRDLTSTSSCPACLSALTSSVCSVCSLDLNHPAARELYQASADAAAALEHRLTLIGRIRYETDELIRRRAATPASPGVASAAQAAAAPPASTASLAARAASPGTQAETSPDVPSTPRAPRRSSVQVVMLIVGVSLLSLAAIFFLVFAFITYGLLARSLIIGAITVAAIAAASELNRKRLRATAESIAAFAGILVFLDAFAIRANDLAGLGTSNGAVFWGTTLVASTIAFVLWHRTSGLRVPSIVASITLAPGAGLLVGGLAAGLAAPGRVFVALAAGAVVGLLHPLAHVGAPPAERVSGSRAEGGILQSMAGLALLCALFAVFSVQPQSVLAGALCLAIVAVVCLAHVAVAARMSRPGGTIRVGAAVMAGIGSIALASTGTAFALRAHGTEAVLFWPAITATVVTLVAERTMRQTTARVQRWCARTATVAAMAVAALALLVPFGVSLVALSVAGEGYWRAWSQEATAEPASVLLGSEPSVALAALAVAVALAAAFWAAAGTLRRRATPLIWAASAVLVLAVPLLDSVALLISGWILIATFGLMLLLPRGGAAPLPVAHQIPIASAGIVSLLLAYSLSWISIDTWGVTTLAAIVLLLSARRIPATRGSGGREMLLAPAIVVALVGAAALARQFGRDAAQWQSAVDSFHFVGILGTLLIVGTALAPRRNTAAPGMLMSRLDRRVTWWIAVPVTLVASASAMGTLAARTGGDAPTGLLLPEYWASLILAALILGALLLWAFGARGTTFRAERAFATLALAPTTYWVVGSFTRAIPLSADVRATSPIVAAVLVAAGSLAAAVLRVPTTRRWLPEIGIALVAAPYLAVTLVTPTDSTWLALLIAGVTALILAVGVDGLFASRSRRRHWGWVAIALATSGLWWRLRGGGVEALEAYVLPVAALLLVTSLFMVLSARRRRIVSRAAPILTLSAMLVAVVPLAADAAGAPTLRVTIIGAASAVLLAVAVSARNRRLLLVPHLDAIAFAAATGVVLTAAGQSLTLVSVPGGNDNGQLELWLGAMFLVLTAAAIGLARATRPADRWHRRAAGCLVVVGMALVLVFECLSIDATAAGLARGFASLVLFLAVYLAAGIWGHAPFHPAVGWTALGFAALTTVVAIGQGAFDPIELGTVPLALALIAHGVVRLAENDRAGSWPTLGPGLIVLLTPSLLVTTGLVSPELISPGLVSLGPIGAGEPPLWRLVALGVAAVAVLVIGVARRLQAPFLLGAVVAVIHGAATFSTQLRLVYEAVPGWIWLGIGGALLIAVAARYERRIKNLKAIALRVAALR